MSKITPYLFLSPAILVLGMTVLFPALQAFTLSFTQYDYDITQAPKWIGLENFHRLAKDPAYWKTLYNTFLYLIVVVPVLVTVPLGLAI
ncbi:MAG: sugar ABC transporter permease, partial [cyanobacterium endosymbiont of Rhopalodia fuxianensis]